MLQLRSMITVADNSGAKILQMVGIPGRGNKKIARIGDVITGVVKKADPTGQVQAHQVTRAVIVRTRKELRRPDGSYIRFDENACVILDAKTQLPKGSRVFGPIAREIKQLGFVKIASLAKEIY
ncbi:50S ribosomal protein L14 [Candidatus Roizmanbacteria bacterium RIFOXYB2_FULL_41_10]|uniref:Large ribosomal subunit protein uL14 n=1 Tax=Candidatus Roizmanbacteria bacterium RIFOXYA1_FULL_41_12 TaxID=1802082 RepID=A0A1F7K975_9BACT|nr:MAG: 50S ribosomal protein L14 [Candidatus Roizmanbacteria bacterium RIFOXYA1_FULL_41_12]OGK67868.1 MAG: 50S ribosomal protein L14 [Candidatus Roizmanbacteria bacterium RIFOXYB1_FULL_41_27]OGK68230.1 MAG: 50S ribosomal protein L14 [Candidatus Roizmanbacteria bacterium RIFOXYA2_FULL_41_8]OGK69209.1 MAG: 50S ribosomal protein L14 [Candidatus Roizmanbacteria bacterium RIFOXYB2_FULL_41_10]OGK72022.1 MAG: 50S ribosomal protein L14 [Candidatus Roizmanbacteria bacterium RIFOXYC1_FULL_41_16]OGK7299